MAVSAWVCRYPQSFQIPFAGSSLWQLSLACQLTSSAKIDKTQAPRSQHTVKHGMLNITVLHGWLIALLWTLDRNMSSNYTLAAFYVSFRSLRGGYRGDVHCHVFLPLQIISRRSAQPVTDIPTHSLMYSFLWDIWVKMIYRAQVCHGRSSLHPPTLHCCCLSDHNTPATHRRHKYPNTLCTLRHHMYHNILSTLRRHHPGTLWLHSSLTIRLSQTERHQNSQKVRIKCLVRSDTAKLILTS